MKGFNYLGRDTSYNCNFYLEKEIPVFQNICGRNLRIHERNVRRDSLFKFYTAMAVSSRLYGNKVRTLTKYDRKRMETVRGSNSVLFSEFRSRNTVPLVKTV